MDQHMSSLLGQRFEDALVFAFRLHRRQTRKGSETPFVSHLLGVTDLVLHYGGSEDQAIAALLHDAAEDQGGEETLAEIERRFGAKIAAMARDCSDTTVTPRPEWEERKRRYLRHLPDVPAETLLVSAADKLYNVRAILADYHLVGEQVWKRFNGGRKGTLWYYRALADEYARLMPDHPLCAELLRAVAQLEKEAGVVEPSDWEK